MFEFERIIEILETTNIRVFEKLFEYVRSNRTIFRSHSLSSKLMLVIPEFSKEIRGKFPVEQFAVAALF